MSATVTITVSGPVGSAKSALLGEIEILLKALGVPTRYADEAAALVEKNMTHADWTSAIEMYSPSVVLVEKIEHSVPPAKAEGMTLVGEVKAKPENESGTLTWPRVVWEEGLFKVPPVGTKLYAAILAQQAKGEQP